MADVTVSGRGVWTEVSGDQRVDTPGGVRTDGGLGQLSPHLLLRHLQQTVKSDCSLQHCREDSTNLGVVYGESSAFI